jgi:hypothetical protein
MVASYRHEEHVIIEGETEVAVTANLRRYRNGLRTDWGGLSPRRRTAWGTY